MHCSVSLAHCSALNTPGLTLILTRLLSFSVCFWWLNPLSKVSTLCVTYYQTTTRLLLGCQCVYCSVKNARRLLKQWHETQVFPDKCSNGLMSGCRRSRITCTYCIYVGFYVSNWFQQCEQMTRASPLLSPKWIVSWLHGGWGCCSWVYELCPTSWGTQRFAGWNTNIFDHHSHVPGCPPLVGSVRIKLPQWACFMSTSNWRSWEDNHPGMAGLPADPEATSALPASLSGPI